MSAAPLARRVLATPVGVLTLVAGERGLVAVLWAREDPRRVPLGPAREEPCHPVLAEAARQLGDYFAGARRAFDLPLDFRGTEFQRRVWAELLLIPFGETRSYGALARRLGDPGLMRAVGAANGRNPLSIVAPCHRVVGAAGQLTGFAGGLAAKRYLLALEHRSIFFERGGDAPGAEPARLPAERATPPDRKAREGRATADLFGGAGAPEADQRDCSNT